MSNRLQGDEGLTQAIEMVRAHSIHIAGTDPDRPVTTRELIARLGEGLGGASTAFRERVIRPDDLLQVDFRSVNLEIDRETADTPVLRRQDPSRAAYLVAEFQGQSFGEQVLDQLEQPSPGEEPPGLPLQARLAGVSRLVFGMPGAVAELPYTLDALLQACRTWPMRLERSATPAHDEPLPSHETGLMPGPAKVSRAEAVFDREEIDALSEQLLPGLPEASRDDLAWHLGTAARRVIRKILPGLKKGTADAKSIVSTMESEFAQGQAVAPLETDADREAGRAYFEVTVVSKLIAKLLHESEEDALQIVSVFAPLWPLLGAFFGPHKPGSHFTAIEAPYRLHQSPVEPAAWAHSTSPVDHRGRVELWHTRLAQRFHNPRLGWFIDESIDNERYLRALWSPDYSEDGGPEPGDPFRMPLAPRTRSDIVKNTAGFLPGAPGGETYQPRPVKAQRLILSALGAWLDLDGIWRERPADVSLLSWSHRMAAGRDYYCRIVEEGFLLPFGHAALRVAITERAFEGQDDNRIAPLRLATYIVLGERSRTFPTVGQAHAGRELPFVRVDILTDVSPLLAPIGEDDVEQFWAGVGVEPIGSIAWPRVSGADRDAQFDLAAFDLAGRRTCFSMPLVFVPAGEFERTADIVAAYNLAAHEARTTANLHGGAVRFAPGSPGETEFPTRAVQFGAAPLADWETASGPEPTFGPLLRRMQVTMPALEELLGARVSTAASYHSTYLEHGMPPDAFPGMHPNSGRLFLSFPDSIELGFGSDSEGVPSDRVGALATPNMTVRGVSSSHGLVAGSADEFAAGEFDPASYFENAKLFGTIKLCDILRALPIASGGEGVPRLRTVRLEDRTETMFTIRQDNLRSASLAIVEFLPDAGGSEFRIEVRLVTPAGASPGSHEPEADVVAAVVNFRISVLNCIVLWFDELSFSVEPGKAPDANARLKDGRAVSFAGPLSFVNGLAEFIPSGGFSDPPSFDLGPSGIRAGYSLTLPMLAVGAFSLSNVSLGAGLELPFTGRPISMRFHFGERHDTFNLTVAFLGGGGFLALTVDTEGIREVEAALEFGATAALQLGYASGSVLIRAGIYFRLAPGEGVELVGYVVVAGSMCMLGLITVTVRLHLALGYYKDGQTAELRGQASVTVKVEALFFSRSVTVTVERRFAGSADPLFIEVMPADSTWRQYADAFA